MPALGIEVEILFMVSSSEFVKNEQIFIENNIKRLQCKARPLGNAKKE